ncbi:MAG: hypothetical protein ACR2JV_01990 [Gaiellales bacterium]
MTTPPKRRKPKPTAAEGAVRLMLSWAGQTEDPPNSNTFPPLQAAVRRLVARGVKVPRWQTAGGFAWCVWACFVAYAHAGSRSAQREIENSNAAWTMRVLQDAENRQNGLRIMQRPRYGDVVLFDFPAGDKVDHAGLLLSWTKDTVTCIEGNTSSGSLGNQANGGGCYRRTRPRANVRAFVRVGP